MAKRIFRPLDGVLLFDKPLELSSNTALQKVRRLFQAEKAGHTGTLDPLATGLLPICFGEATKFSTALLDADKTYRALLRLGQTTSTGDAEGEIVAEHPVDVRQADVDAVLAKFRGEIRQLPPMHSALKHQGKPLYEYIRKGETIARELRNVTIRELVLNSFSGNEMDITVRCSKGTYIRTLAEDIGATLGCGAHLIGLRRTAVAHFDLNNASNLQQLEAMAEAERDARILPLEALMPGMPKLQLDAVQIKRLAQGQRLGLDTGLPDGKVCLHGPLGFIGTGLLQGRRLAPERLLSGVAKQAASAGRTENFGVEQ
ncbi:MAG: tRNA pseudouridine(55) synthase TruB [Gallionellales bacterium RIFCSPLOWO2_12_FULL_59_22]|nr:MAG: tRNA pseudouridine(55) synthase TruB [Gallionellales bacterium RIFCSPLOWO2_02_FULL_59_110]OGT11701.1 MAG: tRNA pseudouridine(55) synthase TruB [Gallionellales bacterium RIFCSPLOWO2_12_FULL_59_22]